MRILIMNNGQREPKALLDLFHNHDCDLIEASAITPPTSFAKYDLVITNGSSHHPIPYATALLESRLTWLKNLTIPVIGICYGAELLATAYAVSGPAVLTDAGDKFRGIVTVCPQSDSGWFFPRSIYAIYEAHRWNVTHLPDEFVTHIKNQRGSILFSHRTKPVVGCLFHPEKHLHDTDGVELLNICLEHLGLPQIVGH